MKTLLCVEDELDLLRNNSIFFEERGYTVLAAENLTQAREYLDKQTPDAIILDIMLPDGNGLDLLLELRAQGVKTPILMLTAWGRNENIAHGLRAGANDYISKPFSYDVLLARVETMFRNVEQVPETVARGPLKLDIAANRAFLNGEDMLLTHKEFALLLLFLQYEGRTMSAEYLYEKVWGQPINDDNRTLKKHLSNLRKKLEEGNSGYEITMSRGEGYRFEKTAKKTVEALK
jgi:DNA-binding response OmpR family regulator